MTRAALILALAAVIGGCGSSPPTAPSFADVRQAFGPPLPWSTVDDPDLAQCPSAAVVAALAITVEVPPALAHAPLVCTAKAGSRNLIREELYIYSVLQVMSRLQFTQPLPWTAASLWDWFKALDPIIEIGPPDSSPSCPGCRSGTRRVLIPVSPDSAIHWLAMTTSAGVFAHEARHIEVGGHTCGNARDQRLADMGAFGVHNSVYTWIADYSAPGLVPEDVRADLRRRACQQRNSAFCHERCP